MSDAINPSSSPSAAAQQIIVELIRAGKVSNHDAAATAKEINELYAKLVEGYKTTNNR